MLHFGSVEPVFHILSVSIEILMLVLVLKSHFSILIKLIISQVTIFNKTKQTTCRPQASRVHWFQPVMICTSHSNKLQR